MRTRPCGHLFPATGPQKMESHFASSLLGGKEGRTEGRRRGGTQIPGAAEAPAPQLGLEGWGWGWSMGLLCSQTQFPVPEPLSGAAQGQLISKEPGGCRREKPWLFQPTDLGSNPSCPLTALGPWGRHTFSKRSSLVGPASTDATAQHGTISRAKGSRVHIKRGQNNRGQFQYDNVSNVFLSLWQGIGV